MSIQNSVYGCEGRGKMHNTHTIIINALYAGCHAPNLRPPIIPSSIEARASKSLGIRWSYTQGRTGFVASFPTTVVHSRMYQRVTRPPIM